MRISGATTLITGASSGIGAATARAVAAAGGRIVLAGRDRERLAAVAEETGGVPLVSDLAPEDGAGSGRLSPSAGAGDLARRVIAQVGTVDILVNNAGLGWAGPVLRMAAADIDRLIAVDLAAPIHLTRLLAEPMHARRRGHLVFVASIAGAVGVRDEAVYSAVKAGLMTFAEGLRHELRDSGVGVSVIVPGVVDTPFFERRGMPYERSRPVPITADRVARSIVAAIEGDRAETYAPGWMRIPARLRGAAPGVFRTLAGRFG